MKKQNKADRKRFITRNNRQQNIKTVALLFILLWLFGIDRFANADEAVAQQQHYNLPTIAIIIDDMGNYQREGWQLINMPFPMTLSFLPKRPFTEEQARSAHFTGKEVMMHAPMTTILNLKLGYGALTGRMSEANFKTTLRNDFLSVPFAVGVNNHMGSQLTQKFTQMAWVMQTLSRYPVYFVDSRTIATSVAGEVSRDYRIPTLRRDVFLDNKLSFRAINIQFKRLIKIARQYGTAIAIGHPHQATVDYLEYALPKLDAKGIGIATISGLWEIRHHNQTMFPLKKRQEANLRLAERKNSVKKTQSVIN